MEYRDPRLPNVQGPRPGGQGGFVVNLSELEASQAATQLHIPSFVAEAGAGAAIGRGLEGVANGLESIASVQFESINRRKVDEAGAKLTAANDEIAALIAAEPDETKWPALFQREAAKWQNEILKDQTLSPAARDAIETKISGWKITTESNVRRTSFNRSLQKEAEGLEGARLMALNAGEFDRAEELTQEQERRGLIASDTAARQRIQAGNERERREKKIQAEARSNEVNRLAEAIAEDPWAAKAALEAGHFAFDPSEKAAALSDADRAIAAKQREGIQEIRDSIVSGFAGEDEINVMADTYRLGAEDREAQQEFRRKYLEAKAAAGPMDRKALAELRGEIESYKGDEKSDPLAAKWGELVNRAELLTVGGGKEGDLTRGALMQSLYLRHPFQERRKSDSQDENLAEIEAKFTASLEKLAADGGFGPLQVPVPNMKADAEGKLVQDSTEKFKLAPNADARRKQAYAQATLWRSLLNDYRANPDKWADPNYIDEWLRGPEGRLRNLSAGAEVEKMRQEMRGPSSPLIPFNMENPAAAPTTDQLESLLK